MAQAFKLPDLGEGLTEGEVAPAVRGRSAEDDPLVGSTDKATVEIPSPYAGTVLGSSSPRARSRRSARRSS